MAVPAGFDPFPPLMVSRQLSQSNYRATTNLHPDTKQAEDENSRCQPSTRFLFLGSRPPPPAHPRLMAGRERILGTGGKGPVDSLSRALRVFMAEASKTMGPVFTSAGQHLLEHDPEKRAVVSRKNHAQTKDKDKVRERLDLKPSRISAHGE